MVLLVTETLSS